MSTVLAGKVMSKVHHYAEVEADAAPPCLSACLGKDAFQPSLSSGSLPFSMLVSTSASVPWHSPGAVNWSMPTADLDVVRQASSANDWAMLDACWLSTLVRPGHRLLLQFPGDPIWYFGLHAWADSSALVFLATTGRLSGVGDNAIFWEVDASMRKPVLKVVNSLSTILAVCFEWHSPVWQAAQSRGLSQPPPAIRAFSTSGPPQSLQRLAAQRAFWTVENATLGRIASHLGCTIRAGSSLFDTVWQLVQACLPELSDSAIMTIVRLRVAAFGAGDLFTEELLQVDEAVAVLEKSDERRLHEEQKACRELRTVSKEYRHACREKSAKYGRPMRRRGSPPTGATGSSLRRALASPTPPGSRLGR